MLLSPLSNKKAIFPEYELFSANYTLFTNRSDNDSGSETELDCFPSDDEYDFDNLNQLLRKATDIESDEEDEENDINDIDKVNE